MTGLEQLAWAGALDALAAARGNERRAALWRLGIAARSLAAAPGAAARPRDRDAGATARDPLGAGRGCSPTTRRAASRSAITRSGSCARARTGRDQRRAGPVDDGAVAVAGLVVARQRPETASGVVFMLLEDEHGASTWSSPPSTSATGVVRAPLVLAKGRLERREGDVNVLVQTIAELERTAAAQGRPPAARLREEGEPASSPPAAKSPASSPSPSCARSPRLADSFGRRGR